MAIDTRISLRKLEVLSLVVQLGGVGRAADRLFVAQPVVTAHIRSIEERLGVKLFYREGRQLHLTEAGRAVHEWAQDVLARTHELDRHLIGLSDGSEGTIVFGASISFGSYRLPHVLAAFHTNHALVELRLRIADTEQLIEDTRTGALDFAVAVTERQLALPGMHIEEIGVDEIVLVAAPDSEPHAEVIAAQDLIGLPCVEAFKGIIGRTLIDRQLHSVGIVERNIVLELGHPEAMKRATQEGLGVAMLFRSIVDNELATGVLREIRIEDMDVVVPISLIYRKGKAFSRVHLELIEDIRTLLDASSDRFLQSASTSVG